MLALNFSPFPVLETERLILRRMTAEDIPDFFRLRSDPEMMKYIDRPLAVTHADAEALLKKIEDALEKNEGITWGISLKNNPALVGTIGFWRIEKEHYRAEIGYMLDKLLQGKGLMQEAMTTVLEFGFKQMHLHSVEANVNPDNDASKKILEKNNFVKEAYFKENYFSNGRFLDTIIYSLVNTTNNL